MKDKFLEALPILLGITRSLRKNPLKGVRKKGYETAHLNRKESKRNESNLCCNITSKNRGIVITSKILEGGEADAENGVRRS